LLQQPIRGSGNAPNTPSTIKTTKNTPVCCFAFRITCHCKVGATEARGSALFERLFVRVIICAGLTIWTDLWPLMVVCFVFRACIIEASKDPAYSHLLTHSLTHSLITRSLTPSPCPALPRRYRPSLVQSRSTSASASSHATPSSVLVKSSTRVTETTRRTSLLLTRVVLASVWWMC
jgi:hypothetical protein